MRVLIAEDDPVSRRLLQARLCKWGYDVVVACDGTEAWKVLQDEDAPKLAILDWMMPGMDGVEVCRRVRQWKESPYTYILLLTAKNQKEDIIEGMTAGADDYITKPTDAHELKVRLRAGQRILNLQAALLGALAERKQAEEALAEARRHEIKIASDIQKMLLLDKPPHLPGISVAARTIPSKEVDGDFYYFFKYREKCLDVIVGDVMGKGVPAALLGAGTKSQFLRARSHLISSSDHKWLPKPEDIVMQIHTEVTSQLIDLGSFVTLCYARFDLERNRIDFVDCGHTKTIHFRHRTGTCETLEGENMPLGFSDQEIYRQVSVPFEVGDVFVFYSDGVSEARNGTGEFFGVDRLAELVRKGGQLEAEELIDRIHTAVTVFSNSEAFVDDLTCVTAKIEETD